MDYIWVASIWETCLQIMIDLLEIRNKEVHGKEEVMKQQKKKANVANSVQALYKLQGQDRPSNTFLAYQDVKEEIKHTTAAKLEGFIAVETRPITNSVRK